MNEPRSANADAGGDTTLEVVGDTELVITRSFAAPATRVFDAVTKPEHVRRWWAPKSRGEIVSVEIDCRVGGAWRYVMKSKKGFEVAFKGVYLEIERPTRIVNTEIFEPFPDAVATVTVTLDERDGKTTLTTRSRYPSRHVRDQVIASGMESGMRESMRQLTDVIASE
jgi:uncharacterized protein YndB with AHSA1/START domain